MGTESLLASSFITWPSSSIIVRRVQCGSKYLLRICHSRSSCGVTNSPLLLLVDTGTLTTPAPIQHASALTPDADASAKHVYAPDAAARHAVCSHRISLTEASTMLFCFVVQLLCCARSLTEIPFWVHLCATVAAAVAVATRSTAARHLDARLGHTDNLRVHAVELAQLDADRVCRLFLLCVVRPFRSADGGRLFLT